MMSEFMEWTNNGSQQIFIFYNLEIGTAILTTCVLLATSSIEGLDTTSSDFTAYQDFLTHSSKVTRIFWFDRKPAMKSLIYLF